MKFTKIKRLISNAYDCSNIQLECEIEEGETIEDADFILRTRLSAMISDDVERRVLCRETDSLKRETDSLKKTKSKLMKDCETLRKLISDKRQFLEKNGIKIDDFLYSEMPFDDFEISF